MNAKSRKNKSSFQKSQQNESNLQSSSKNQTKTQQQQDNSKDPISSKDLQSPDAPTSMLPNVNLKSKTEKKTKEDNPEEKDKFKSQALTKNMKKQEEILCEKKPKKDQFRQTKGINKQKSSSTLKKENQAEKHLQIPKTDVQSQFKNIIKQMQEKENEKNIKKDDEDNLNTEIDLNLDNPNTSTEFQILEETVKQQENQKQQKQKEEPEERHYVIPGTVFEGQFVYVTKEKKEEDVEEQLENLEEEKKQLEISTEHYVNPSTVVQGQISTAGKELKKEEIQKEVKKVEEKNEKQNSKEKSAQKPKIIHRVNLHEFQSTEVPELHEQDIPLHLQPDEDFQNLHTAIEQIKEIPIKQLQPVPVKLTSQNQTQIQPAPLELLFQTEKTTQTESQNMVPDQSIKQQNIKKEQNQKEEPEERHYVIPGTVFEGQFVYVTKEKKEEDVEEQLENLEEEKKQLEISTEHYVNPSTVVQGQISTAGKELKKEEIQKEVRKVEEENEKQNSKEKSAERPKIIHRVNLHEFQSTEVPELHEQDIPLHLQPDEDFQNLHTAIEQIKELPIKPLEPVPVKLTSKVQQRMKPIYIDVPKKQDFEHPEKEHYIIPGTMFEGQYEYVTKEKKEQDVQEQLENLQQQKRELQISTEHYINPSTVVEGQTKNIGKQARQDQIQRQSSRSLQQQKETQRKIQEQRAETRRTNNIARQNFQTTMSEVSNVDLQKLMYLKEKGIDEGSLKLEIMTDEEKPLRIKIDQHTGMTVVSSNSQERPSYVLPKQEEPNYDLEVLVMETSLNKESSSPQNAFRARPTDLVNMNKVPEMIDGLKNRNGQPIKVFISTKQFANFPNQVTPSPPIIDQCTLDRLRQKNEEQMKKTGEVVSPPPKVLGTRNSNDEIIFETKVISTQVKGEKQRIQHNGEKYEIQHAKFIVDIDRIKRVTGDQNEERPFMPKLLKSLAVSVIVGGLAWVGFKEKKITAIGAAAGLTLSLIAQK